MNSNVGIQTPGLVAWDGAASFPREIRKYTQYGFTFETTALLAADAVFKLQSAPPSAADPCVPGTFTDVLEVAICQVPATGALATITIPANTPAGQMCNGTFPCYPDAFVQLVPVSGPTASVKAVLILKGPMY